MRHLIFSWGLFLSNYIVFQKLLHEITKVQYRLFTKNAKAPTQAICIKFNNYCKPYFQGNKPGLHQTYDLTVRYIFVRLFQNSILHHNVMRWTYNAYKNAHFFSFLFFFFFFFFFFDLSFTAVSRIFHLYRAYHLSKMGENQRTRGKPSDHP